MPPAPGCIDGSELVRYTGSLTGDALPTPATAASQIIVTDSNRDRAHQWRGSQDVTGFTEDGDPTTPDLLRRDPADQRLPVFGDTDAPATIAVQEGPVVARASAYGEPFAYRPEDRAVMAIDGDPTTAWRVADRSDPIGEQLQLDVSEPIDHLTFTQPVGADCGSPHRRRHDRHPGPGAAARRARSGLARRRPARRHRADHRSEHRSRSRSTRSSSPIRPSARRWPPSGSPRSTPGWRRRVEVVEPPSDATTAAAAADGTPVSYVFTRLRTRPTDRWRSDPEPTMVRRFDVSTDSSFTPEITVRLDQRASDATLAALLGITGPQADRRLIGAATAAGWALADARPGDGMDDAVQRGGRRRA